MDGFIVYVGRNRNVISMERAKIDHEHLYLCWSWWSNPNHTLAAVYLVTDDAKKAKAIAIELADTYRHMVGRDEVTIPLIKR